MDSSVSTVNGIASSTYVANGCVGTDTITATTNIGGTPYSAQATVTVSAPTVGSIQFISASNDVIAIQGTGGSGLSETSTIVFAVYDQNGNPVPNQAVNFVEYLCRKYNKSRITAELLNSVHRDAELLLKREKEKLT